jgi:hypothetical protein
MTRAEWERLAADERATDAPVPAHDDVARPDATFDETRLALA